MLEVCQVVCVLMFKWCFSGTYVYFWHGCVACIHSCLVDNATIFPVKWALVRLSEVVAPKSVFILLLWPTYTGDVAFDNGSHVGHATVADFDRAPVEYLVQLGGSWSVRVEAFVSAGMYWEELQRTRAYPGDVTSAWRKNSWCSLVILLNHAQSW